MLTLNLSFLFCLIIQVWCAKTNLNLEAANLLGNLVEAKLEKNWQRFKSTFNKSFTALEETVRRLKWQRNLNLIEKHNKEADAGLHKFTMKMNKYGDLSNAEFRTVMNGFKRQRKLKKNTNPCCKPPINTDIPSAVDWRTKGYVTEVKDQGECGSCWAFSTTGAIEGQHFNATGKLVSLSEQNLVDCSKDQNEGCDGGYVDQAFQYVIDNNGIDTEDSYKYTGKDGKCSFIPCTVGANITSYQDITEGSESDLTSALANIGPISVAIDASLDSFQFYSSGVYNDQSCSSTELNHAVLAVGYDTDPTTGQDYYIVKNSWGTTWGMDGYILIARNNNNQCGIATSASYPIV